MIIQCRCFECDSEYQLEYQEGMIADEPQYCVVCKEPIEIEVIEEEDE